MTTRRDGIRLSPQQLALKAAFAEAVRAAGGQVFVGGEVGRAQSRISDWQSPNATVFAPLDVVVMVEALGAGSPGHPHVTRALARAAGGAFVAGEAGVRLAAPLLGQWLGELAGESGDVIGLLSRGRLAEPIAALTPRERGALANELNQLSDVLNRLERELDEAGTDTS